jgi:outer membrane protein TolC
MGILPMHRGTTPESKTPSDASSAANGRGSARRTINPIFPLPPADRMGRMPMPLSFFAATLLLSSCTPVAVEDLPMAAATPARSLKEIGNADAVPADPDGSYPIDLPTALRLAAGRNLDLARAVERTRLAAARSDQAQLSIVPDLQSGASFGRKNGLLQDIAGAPIQTQRVDRSAGLGASTGLPGVSVDLGLSDAIFNPLAAKQDQKAALASSRAREHQVLAATAIAYFELVRAHGHLQLAREIEAASRKLADDTTAFARAGEGLEADSARATATYLLRKGDRSAAEAERAVRSADLARLLHLPASLELVPADSSVAATHLVDASEPAGRLVATALRHRPEAEAIQSEVSAATARLRQQQMEPFLPHVAAGYSSYDYSAGRGVGSDEKDTRDEVSALIYWKLEGLGFGNAADSREQRSELALVRLEEERLIDEISHQVTSARAEVLARRDRLSIGGEAATHAKRAYQLTVARLEQSQGLPIEALASVQTLAEARRAEIDAVLDYNIAQHRLFAAIGHPASK